MVVRGPSLTRLVKTTLRWRCRPHTLTTRPLVSPTVDISHRADTVYTYRLRQYILHKIISFLLQASSPYRFKFLDRFISIDRRKKNRPRNCSIAYFLPKCSANFPWVFQDGGGSLGDGTMKICNFHCPTDLYNTLYQRSRTINLFWGNTSFLVFINWTNSKILDKLVYN